MVSEEKVFFPHGRTIVRRNNIFFEDARYKFKFDWSFALPKASIPLGNLHGRPMDHIGQVCEVELVIIVRASQSPPRPAEKLVLGIILHTCGA